MKKKWIRGLFPAMAVAFAMGMTAGCSADGSASGTSASGTSASSTSAQETSTEAESTEGGSETAAKDSLIIATANETPSVTTNEHNAVAGNYMNQLTYNGLFKMDDTLTPVPDLVESYENTSDTEWVFHLKQGVLFHNGEEMTAKDVKASLELCKESPEVSQYGAATQSVEVVDDYTVKVTTDGPQSGLLSNLTHHGNFILPADLIESGHDFNKEPIGTGPYKLVAWNRGESLEFEAFEDYFGGAAPIKQIIWKIIPEGSSRTMALEAGEVDMIIEVETADLTRLSGLTFENPDTDRFPSLLFASEAIRRGGIAGAVMNAANEVAVERFRAGELKFTGIFDVVERTMNQFNRKGAADMDTILEADRNAREFARQLRKG